jgi:UDP-glucose 4-epimerase
VRALVVGGAGFIGSSLVERLLAERWHVEVVDDLSSGSLERLAEARAGADRALRIHRHDIGDATTADLVERAAPDRIFFLADPVGEPDPVRRVEVGVVGLVRVLEGASRLVEPPKIVLTLAAADLYAGLDEAAGPITEDAEVRAVGAGGAAAVAALAALRAYRIGSSIEHTVIVLSEVYGPDMPVRGDLGMALAAASDSGRVLVDRRFDLVYLDDTVDALVRAASRADGLLVHVSSGDPVPGAEIASTLTDLGRPVALAGARSVLIPALDIGRAEIHLGWKPFTTLANGLDALV